MKSFLLPGFAGENPLGFLAAVGLLRMLTESYPKWQPRLNWNQKGAWRPIVAINESISEDDFLKAVFSALDSKRKAFSEMRKKVEPNLKLERRRFRDLCSNLRDSPAFAYVASCMAELPLNDDQITVSPLRMVNGSGHQDFLPIMKEIADSITEDQVRQTLFGSWRYLDSGSNRSLRWDPADKREYALRWDNPSTDPATVELAANRLAIEALPILPMQPQTFRARATGFHFQRRTRATFFRWPLWCLRNEDGALSPGATVDSVRCLLDLRELAEPQDHRAELRALGVAVVYQSQRLQDGYYGNFAPASAI